MKHKTIAVIGLGQFGGTVAKMLASMKHEVLGVDIDPEVVQKISPFITHAIVDRKSTRLNSSHRL